MDNDRMIGLNRSGMRNRLKRVILITIPIVLLILAAPTIFLLGTMGISTVKERFNRRTFDSQVWKQGNQDEVRIRMVDCLLRRYNLIGKSRSEVVELIGEPDNTLYFREYDMVSRLGNERGFIGIDSEWLVLRLDTGQVVTEFRIVRD